MTILITGANGQLGQALSKLLPDSVAANQPEFELDKPESVDRMVAAVRPDLIIHAAAMTDVDGAARDPGLAYRVNGVGTQTVALAAARYGAALAYISTNEVFDGEAGRPYAEFDQVRAVNPYGASKLAGEWFVQHLSSRFYIIRTAWVTAPGGRNFVHRIQQLADERGSLQVVNDEVANPGADTIQFAAALYGLGGGTAIVILNDTLPTIIDDLTIDGTNGVAGQRVVVTPLTAVAGNLGEGVPPPPNRPL